MNSDETLEMPIEFRNVYAMSEQELRAVAVLMQAEILILKGDLISIKMGAGNMAEWAAYVAGAEVSWKKPPDTGGKGQ